MGKISCEACKKSCKSQAIRLDDKYFHLKCFTCKACKKQLPASEFYSHGQDIYCSEDYQELFGTKCRACGKYAEGNVVTVLGQTYHEDCFQCNKCSKKFELGDKVTFNGEGYLCNNCAEQCQARSSSEHHSAADADSAAANLDYKYPQDDGTGRQQLAADDGRSSSPHRTVNYGKFYQMSYLDKVNDFKRGPSLNPSGMERSPKHYHRPENFSYSSIRRDFIVPAKRETTLLTDLESETFVTSAKSDIFFPIRNKEPIRLARLPDAHLPDKNVEKNDWSLLPDLSAVSHRGLFTEADNTDVSSSAKADPERDVDAAADISSPPLDRPHSVTDRCSSAIGYGESGRPTEDATGDSEKFQFGLLKKPDASTKFVSSSCDGIDVRQNHDLTGETGQSTVEEYDPTTGLRRLKLLPLHVGYRRSVPCLFKVVEAPKIYRYEQLKHCRDKLPPDVEWVTVERHLSKDEFEGLFHMSRHFFYQLAEWKRNDLKARVGLF